jgi:uncharacterized membrane protein
MTSHLVCKIPIPLCLSLLFWNALPTFAASYREVNVPGSTYTAILGINSAGDMVGQYIKPSGRGSGFLYSNGSFADINYPGTTSDAATGINDRGDIVGTYYTDSIHSFLYHDGQFTLIAYPGATSTQANGINNAGDIAGGYVDPASKWHGFLLHQGVFISVDVPGANGTEAFGVNNQGVVSGNFATDCDFNCDLIESFLFYRGHLRVVGALNTEIRGINNRNQVVGDCNVVEGGNVTGCLLARHEAQYWNYPGMYSTNPYGINDAGVVVGEIVDYSSLTHGFVANP